MNNPDRIAIDNSVKYFERVTNQRKHAHARPLLDARSAFRRVADLLDNIPMRSSSAAATEAPNSLRL